MIVTSLHCTPWWHLGVRLSCLLSQRTFPAIGLLRRHTVHLSLAAPTRVASVPGWLCCETPELQQAPVWLQYLSVSELLRPLPQAATFSRAGSYNIDFGLNVRSIANNLFILNELFVTKALDFLQIAETLQRANAVNSHESHPSSLIL